MVGLPFAMLDDGMKSFPSFMVLEYIVYVGGISMLRVPRLTVEYEAKTWEIMILYFT